MSKLRRLKSCVKIYVKIVPNVQKYVLINFKVSFLPVSLTQSKATHTTTHTLTQIFHTHKYYIFFSLQVSINANYFTVYSVIKIQYLRSHIYFFFESRHRNPCEGVKLRLNKIEKGSKK